MDKLLPSDEKVIERIRYEIDPIEIESLSVRNTKLSRSEKVVRSGFDVEPKDTIKFSVRSLTEQSGGNEEDWLTGLEFTFRNKSDKQVIFICYTLDFPETDINGSRMGYQITKGTYPDAAKTGNLPSEAFALPAGELATILLSDQQLKMLKDFLALRKFLLAELNRVEIRTDLIVYSDGTRWSSGHYYKPNPDKPSGYERIVQ